MKRPSVRTVPLRDDPTWYKDAVIYEIRTRSFFDSNGDGIGDFKGITSKLDYVQDLGATCLWLLPFFPSPYRDDGYDIADYTDVDPDVGTLADFEIFLREAHQRGLRVVIELVLNHTSDEHPWFQRARHAPAGSPERDFYVWSETPDRYRDARIIFKDFEPSNWSWDRVAKAYYWHRFYAHQPDLNWENPAVKAAMFGVIDFWFGMGVDGLRLDAIPYLYEAEGTNCENDPRTHDLLKELRAHVDANFKNRLLLAEANQWPEDAAAYFGAGDECHMNFHFPLMPRMFLAIHMEDRFPITDIFAQTPAVHPSCQWALFLRNHDELTLEMVTDEERDYMYRAYADQQAMRINLGIRRRLAPLVENDRRKMELLNGLLLSLPGTPVLYYGDEIGMGDNVYLGDRNGVRTPMQWSMDRNAGFSTANPQSLILPVILDPEYHYESLNVETEQQNPTSLLWWTKRVIALRRRFAAFGRGSTEFLSPANPRVLAFVREYEGERVLIVANLSRFVQYVELDLAKQEGTVPVELFGKSRFPAVGRSAYPLTLGPHAFYWFSLEVPSAEVERRSLLPEPLIPAPSLEALVLGDERAKLEGCLAAFLDGCPWFTGPRLQLRRVELIDAAFLPAREPRLLFAFVRSEYEDASADEWCLPLAWVDGTSEPTGRVLARVALAGSPKPGALVDAADEPSCTRALLEAIGRGEKASSGLGTLVSTSTEALAASHDPRKVGHEHLDTTLVFGEEHVLKLPHTLQDGAHPELEILRFMSRHPGDLAPRLVGNIDLRRGRREPATLAVVEKFVPNLGTGWQLASEELGRYFDRVLARTTREAAPPLPVESLAVLAGHPAPPPLVAEMIGAFRTTAAQLGARVAQLHVALVGDMADPGFAPEPYSLLDRRSKYQSLRNLSGRVLRALRERQAALPAKARGEAARVLAREAQLLVSFEPLRSARLEARKIRTHGNLHLGHVLYTGRDFTFIGFGGHPGLSLAERRRKRSPLRDLAALTCSYRHAAMKRLFDPTRVRETDVEVAHPWALHWTTWVSAAAVEGYVTAIGGAGLVPADRAELAILFDAFVVERTLHELRAALEEGNFEEATLPLYAIGQLLR